jgi:hypothetical protein
MPQLSKDPPRFSKGSVDPYGGWLLPICCPTEPTPPLGAATSPGQTSWRLGEVRGRVRNFGLIDYSQEYSQGTRRVRWG